MKLFIGVETEKDVRFDDLTYHLIYAMIYMDRNGKGFTMCIRVCCCICVFTKYGTFMISGCTMYDSEYNGFTIVHRTSFNSFCFATVFQKPKSSITISVFSCSSKGFAGRWMGFPSICTARYGWAGQTYSHPPHPTQIARSTFGIVSPSL